jgi:energy-coupling factor transporter ATP-binding protein EcfA2
MLTRVKIRNFKPFEEIEVELGQTVMLVGPNNSGKTSVLQALALWYIARVELAEEGDDVARFPITFPARFAGPSAINRLDLVSIPVPDISLIWRNRDVGIDEPQNEPIEIWISVTGVTDGIAWEHAFRFIYTNEESIEWRIEENKAIILSHDIAPFIFLPPISGLAAVEPRLEPGRINVLIGEGRTAEVLRNLCHRVYDETSHWNTLTTHIQKLFGVKLDPPKYLQARGEIRMSYRDPNGVTLDLSASGRGMQQILLLLAYLYTNPGAVLLLDEPDAHLEILRQRQIYDLLTDIARQQGAQIIATTHSEVLLEEAFDRDMVVAMLGTPHRIDNNSSRAQLEKALKQINATDYYQAEQTGWVLYLEGATDLKILREFARLLDHPAQETLENVFVHYVESDQPHKAYEHFFGLREATPNLLGYALFDRMDKNLKDGPGMTMAMWRQREIENYLTMPEVLLAYARYDLPDRVFSPADAEQRVQTMQQVINDVTQALATLGKPSPWSADIKATDDFLRPVFQQYFDKLQLPNLLNKTDYHILAREVPVKKLDPEITEKLDQIVNIAIQAKPQ